MGQFGRRIFLLIIGAVVRSQPPLGIPAAIAELNFHCAPRTCGMRSPEKICSGCVGVPPGIKYVGGNQPGTRSTDLSHTTQADGLVDRVFSVGYGPNSLFTF